MKEKIMNGFMGFAMFLQNQRHFRAIKNAFSSLLPIIIVGSFCTLFSNVVCSTAPGYFSLANVPGFSWLGKLAPMFTAANYGTMNFIAIGLVVLLSMELSETYDVHDRVLPIVAVASYISLCSTTITVTDETVVLLTQKRKSKDYKVEIEIPIGVDGSKTYTEEKSTYQNIKKFIKAKYGVNTHTKDIAEVKRDCGVEMRLNYNISKKENPKIRHCTQEKRGYIMDALEHYQVI